MKKTKVAILIGSSSDLPLAKEGIEVLQKLNIPFDLHLLSAHRTPKAVLSYVKNAPKKGIRVFIVGAGMAAHLGGVVAAHTLHPVIGVPIDGTLDGLDALLSTVQMPKGVPVATVTIGKTGFINASLLAAQILSLSDDSLFKKLKKFRQKMTKEVLALDRKIDRTSL